MKYLVWFTLFLCTVVASSSSLVFPLGSASEWYEGLNHPWFRPPNWLFGPVWTTLYLLIATSASKLLLTLKIEVHKYLPLAIALWALQMVLNTIWTPVFSGAENLEAAFYYIAPLWLTIIAYIAVTWNISRLASILFVPYAAWVSFASLLNYTYWQLN